MLEQIAVAGVTALFVLCIVLRIILHASYQTAIAVANRAAKAVKSKEDIGRLGVGAYPRAAREYAALAGAGAKVDAHKLAEGSIVKNRLMLFNFNSIGGFITAVESAFVPLVLVIAVAVSDPMPLVIIFAVMFVAMRMLAAFFDIQTIRQRYVENLASALVTTVGRFFPDDKDAAVYTFSEDLNGYLKRQSDMFSDVLAKVNSEFSSSIKTGVGAMTAAVETTLAAVARKADEIQLGERNAVLEQSLALAEVSQQTLAVSVAQYEASLRGITEQIGSAMGENVAYHMGEAGMRFSDEVGKNLMAMQTINMEFSDEIKAIFAQISAQNKAQTELLMQMMKGDKNE